MTGTIAPEDEPTPTTVDAPGATTAKPRTGTSLTGGPEEPPTGDETEAQYADALVAWFESDPDEVFTPATSSASPRRGWP